MARHPLIGKPAPEFTLKNYNGEDYHFSGGQPTALFFYSKAGGYGCTRQACQIRDALETKEHFKNLEVVGISPDSVEKQASFAEKQKISYPLLSDAHGNARRVYGVGKGLLGLVSARVTFLIDSDGIVCNVLESTVNYGAHSKFVSKWLTHQNQKAEPQIEGAVPQDEPVLELTSPHSHVASLPLVEEQLPEVISLDIPRVSEHPPQL